uniref:Putative conserved plasma membrane protein n=1 Tax=Culex tarsalis TaxID=7177 RepID=A0A1Q3FJI8_CULTA
MSGDVQPRKRKDKKRKKDDEDTVKETPVQKAPSAGAAQAAAQAGDVQMHVHSDHGGFIGGHWCAKIVFFILLAGLGALIGLILIENRGLSNDDTPLSESRYAEYFSGWVDENREDDHHHEEILNALNQLEEHDEDGHDDVESPNDGEPYAEEEDHDDDDHAEEEEDDDEEEEPKLDDDEIEEIVATEQKVAEQEAAVAEDEDEDEDNDNGDEAEEEEDDDEKGVEEQEVDEDDDEKEADENDDDNDDDGDDQPDELNDNDNDDNNDNEDDGNDDDDGDDDDDDDEIANEIDELADADDDTTPFEEEIKTNALNGSANNAPISLDPLKLDREVPGKPNNNHLNTDEALISKNKEPIISAEMLESQMSDLVDNYNKLAEMLNIPKEESAPRAPQLKDDDDNDLNEADEEEQDEELDENDDFENFVDNDGGEEEYLSRVKQEQQQQSQQKQQEKQQSREESSLAVQILVGAALIGAARLVLKPPSGPRPSAPSKSAEAESTHNMPLPRDQLKDQDKQDPLNAQNNLAEPLIASVGSHPKPESILKDFINAGIETIDGNVILIEDDQAELYSGDEAYEYEQDLYDSELEEIEEEAEEEVEDLVEKQLEQEEREIGTFVPTTFEEFSAMYRVPNPPKSEDISDVGTNDKEKHIASGETSHKESPLMKKKPPKGAVNKLIYGLHKDPIITSEDTLPRAEKGEAKSVLAAMLMGIHSPSTEPPVPEPSTASIKILTTTIIPAFEPPSSPGANEATSAGVREKHVEFLLPEDPSESDFSEMDHSPDIPDELELPLDNGSKENLFIPSEEFQLEEEWDDDLVYEGEEDIDSMLLQQYPSDESEGSFSDDIRDDDISDVDDTDLMRRLDEKYGKLEVNKDPNTPAEDHEQSWTKIPARPSEAQPYQEELDRANRQLDEEFGFE